MLRNNCVYLALALVTTAAVGCGDSGETPGAGGSGGREATTSSVSSVSSSARKTCATASS